MRLLHTLPIILAYFAVNACGASTPPAQNPSANSAPALGEPDGGGGAPLADAGPASTTTMTLGDGGNLIGSKLSTTTTTTTNSGGVGSPGGGPDPGRSKSDLQTIILSHRDEARACYDRELRKNPQLEEGDLVIHWVINPKGDPTEVAADPARSTITDANVIQCVVDVIKRIQFSVSPRGLQTTANYPFNFRHGGMSPRR